MSKLENLEPARVFHYFEEICGIPHGSGNTDAISEYLVSFAREHSLRFHKDEMNNVVIFKDAYPGYENAPAVILQGHMDMVCEKRADVAHDFLKDGLDLSVENGFVRANGTTLGGDDGIAVACGLAILEDPEIKSPALEVLFTVDEEIGLLGAAGFDCSCLSGKRMINLDSEAEGILWVGCAGGSCVICTLPVNREEGEGVLSTVRIHGLRGGHSGGEIHKSRASATNLIGRFLTGLREKMPFGLASLSGGDKDNAIPRECTAELLIAESDIDVLKEYASSLESDLLREYAGSDEGISVTVSVGDFGTASVLHPMSCEKVMFLLRNMPFGVQKMSGTIEGLVQTSCNLGILRLKEEELTAEISVRSAVGSAKKDLQARIGYLTEFLGGEYRIQGDYPAWEYREDSPLRDIMFETYKEQYGKEPVVAAIHAGLECGLFYEKIPGLDCISIGPDMKDIHTSEEMLDIASTERVYRYVLKVLENLTEATE